MEKTDIQPTCNVFLQSFAIDPEKVARFIRAPDTTKPHGCDDISISMIKICDVTIVEPLCLCPKKSLETGLYPSIWTKASIFPVSNKDSMQSRRIIVQSLCSQFVAKFSKISFLILLSNTGYRMKMTRIARNNTSYIQWNNL